jgi:phage terminase small subunit
MSNPGGKLTPKQIKFAQLVASGKTYTDAYMEAFDTISSGPIAGRKGSELIEKPHVKEYVESLRSAIKRQVVDDGAITLKSHLAEIERIKKLAEVDGKYDTMLKAEELRGKAVGLYVAKTEDVTDPVKKAMGRMKPEEAQAALEALKQVKAIREKAKSAT